MGLLCADVCGAQSLSPDQLSSSQKAGYLINQMEKVMPEAFVKSWAHMRNAVIINVKQNIFSDQCAKYRYSSENKANGKSQGSFYSYLDIRADCLGEYFSAWPKNRWQLQSLESLQQSKLLQDIFKAGLDYWVSRLASIKDTKEFQKLLYANIYYMTPKTLGVNIEQKPHDVYIDFWAKILVAYTTKQSFITDHPDLYFYLKEKYFQNKSYFPVFESNLTEETKKRTSIDNFPSLARVKYIDKNNEAWFVRYQMLKSARETIYVQYWDLADDIFGRSLVGLLLEAIKKRNVKVKIMLDGRGSTTTSRGRLMEVLKHNGAEAVSYNPMLLGVSNIFKFFRVGLLDGFVASNHDKILLVDHTKLITGGRNISREYFLNADEYKKRSFLDADIYAEFKEPFLSANLAFHTEFYSSATMKVWKSPTVNYDNVERECLSSLAALEDIMLGRGLSYETIKLHHEVTEYTSYIEYKNFKLELSPQYYAIKGLDKTSKLVGKDVITQQLFKFIDDAEYEIIIQNPYVVPTKELKERLIAAGSRNVQIYINTTSPASTDSHITQAYLVNHWKKLLREIPNLHLYGMDGPDQLHAKVFVFDQRHTVISSYNLDPLSLKHNSEYGLWIDSEEFAYGIRSRIIDLIDHQALEYDIDNEVGPKSFEKVKARNINYKIMYWFTWILEDWI